MLKNVSQAAEWVEELKKEKISDQSTIIDLQKKLIYAKDLQVKTLQKTGQSEVKTVQHERKTFSSVLQQEIKR